MDAISLYQAGFDMTVASMGTALTSEQARLVSRLTRMFTYATTETRRDRLQL